MQSWKIQFDHAAVAVEDIESFKKLLAVLGISGNGSELVPSQGVNTHFFSASAGNTNLELLEATDPNGVIAQFLKKRGPGIHHLSFIVSDIEAVSTALTSEGFRLIYDSPKPGAHRTKVNFVHPKSTGGILIEISQKMP